MTLCPLPETVSVEEVPAAAAGLDQTPTGGLRRLSVGLLLVYVAILAINSGAWASCCPTWCRTSTRRFAARFLMVVGFYGVQTFGLYILRDYIGMGEAESNSFAPAPGVVLLLGVLLSALTSGWLADRIGRRKPFIAGIGFVLLGAIAVKPNKAVR